MSTSSATRTVNCPNCMAQYKLRADLQGTLKCKKCNRGFAVGHTSSERQGLRSRDRQDQKTAVKLVVACSVALLLIAGVIALAANSTDGSSPQDDLSNISTRSRGRSGLPTNYERTNFGPEIDSEEVSRQPPAVTRVFVTAMANGDRETIKELFLFDAYFKTADLRLRNGGEKYHGGSEGRQAELRELVVSELLDPFLVEILKKHMVPQLEAGEKGVWKSKQVDTKSASMRISCKDENSKDLLMLDVALALKDGMTASDSVSQDAWGVKKVSLRWMQETIASTGDQKRLRGLGVETRERRETGARKGSKGPVEAPAAVQNAVPGTSGEQGAIIEGNVRTLIDEGTSGPDYFKVQDALKQSQKMAIPFLLNELVERDHRENESDIMAAHKCILVMREITGESFGYAPGKAKMRMQSMAAATPEEREKAVRRWFGWWKYNRTSWTRKKIADDVDEEEDK